MVAALAPVLAGLAPLVAPAEECQKDAAPRVDVAQVIAFKTQLLDLLAAGDSGSLDLIADNKGLLVAAFPEERQAIEAAIQGFDFEAALELIRARAA